MNKYLGQITRPVWIAAAIGFVVGLFIGLVVLGWNLWPVTYYDAAPANLRADAQRDYLAMAIQSYARTPDTGKAIDRWKDLGSSASSTLAEIQRTPQIYNVRPEDVSAFAAVVNAAPAPGATPTTTTPASNLTGLLAVMCLLTLVVAGILVYLFLFRGRGGAPSLGRLKTAGAATAAGGQAGTVSSAPAAAPVSGSTAEQPLTKYLTTYNIGTDLYDDSFSIDSPTGEFLGECGVGISETIGVGDPKKVTAFEVWLFDKNDIQTVTKVLMSDHAFNDQVIKQRLASKGEPVLAHPGERILLETATLQLEARVANMVYGSGALPQNSFFDQMTLELSIWPKAK